MPYVADLSGCRAKLARAKEHHAGLEEVIAKFFYQTSNRVHIGAKLDPSSGYHILRVESAPQFIEIQEQVSLIFGDAIHNLRSGLDHLVYQLACQNTDNRIQNVRKLQFLISDNLKEFDDRKHSCLGEVSPKHVQMIETFQPYHGSQGGSDPYNGPYVHQLAFLRDLDNADKHRLLHTVLVQPGGAEFAVPSHFYDGGVPQDFTFQHAGELLEVGAEVMRRRFTKKGVPREMPGIGFAVPVVALEEHRPIDPVLKRLEKYVERILNDFQAQLTP